MGRLETDYRGHSGGEAGNRLQGAQWWGGWKQITGHTVVVRLKTDYRGRSDGEAGNTD